MTEISGRPNLDPNGKPNLAADLARRASFGEPFSPIKTPTPPTKPANANATANEIYRVYERFTGKSNSEIRHHVHDLFTFSVYDWWKIRSFHQEAAKCLAYVRKDALVWACQIAAEQRNIPFADAVAAAGDCPLPDSEDPQSDITAWIQVLDHIISTGALTPGAPPETYAEMRAKYRAAQEQKIAEQKEKAAVKLKDEKPKPAALDAAKKEIAHTLAQGEAAGLDAAKALNDAIATLKDEQDDLTPAEGTDQATGEAVPIEPEPPANDWMRDEQKSAAFHREAINRAFNRGFETRDVAALLMEAVGALDKFKGSANEALKLFTAYLDIKLAPKTHPAPEPPPATETVAEKSAAENKPVDGNKTPPIKDTTNKPLPLVSHLAKMTTLTGVPVGEINVRLDARHDFPAAYKPIELAGGKVGTDIAQWSIRNRFDEVFGPHGIGWKLEPHPVLGAITHEEKTTANGNLKHIVTLIGYIFKYRVVIGDEVEWVELSPMSDSDGNSDKGYAFRGAQTSLLKQVIRSLGGLNHLYRNKELEKWANEEYQKRKQRRAA